MCFVALSTVNGESFKICINTLMCILYFIQILWVLFQEITNTGSVGFSKTIFLLWYIHYFLGSRGSPLLIIIWNHVSVPVVEPLPHKLLVLLLSKPCRLPCIIHHLAVGGLQYLFYIFKWFLNVVKISRVSVLQIIIFSKDDL